MLLWLVISFLVALLGLAGVAFVTLLERKILGLSQVRLGPNKVTFWGLLQPVMDGIKLLLKDSYVVSQSQMVFFLYSPVLILFLFLITWIWLIPWSGFILFLKISSLVFFSLLGLGAYAVIMTGWSSLSSFSKLGSTRGMLQSLSFEVALLLVFLIVLTFFKCFMFTSESNATFELLVLWAFLWVLLSLMETNRAPFDLLEGESELISGFNIEMGSLSFVFLFLSEYGMIIVMSLISSIGFMGNISALSMIFILSFLFIRSCFPRIRYDIMMMMMWQSVLLISLLLYIIFSVLH